MGFTMHVCVSWLRSVALLASGLLLLAAAPAVHAEGFSVVQAETRLVNGVYMLDASMYLRLSAEPNEALANGVPLYFTLDIDVFRERHWWADSTVATLQQVYRLEYHALSERYLVVNLNTGERSNFTHREAALDFIGELRDFPLLDRVFLEEGYRYLGSLQIALDISRLPLPLLTNAYLSAGWSLSSEPFEWLLK